MANIPARKSEVIAGVTEGTPVTSKEDGTKAAKHFDGQLNNVYTRVRKAEADLTALTMINNFGPKDREFLVKRVEAISGELNKVAQITKNIREDNKARLGVQQSVAQTPAPEKTQPAGRIPGKGR